MKTFLEKVCVVSTGRRFHILKCLFQLRVRSITLRSGSKKAFFFVSCVTLYLKYNGHRFLRGHKIRLFQNLLPVCANFPPLLSSSCFKLI